MKKSILTLMSIVALFVTSCVQSDVDGVQTVGEETLVSLSVETSSASSRTIADGKKATKLQYAVYDENWNYIYTAEPVTLVDRKTTFELSLLSGTTYNFAFWADADKGYYTPDFANKKVRVSYTGAEANDESRDAFYGILTVEVKGTTQASVDLKRPFAQVNFGASDLVAAKKAGFNTDSYTTKLTVSTYETLNFVDGSVEDAVEITFAAKAPQTETATLTAGNKDYAWVSMNYVLCPEANASLGVCTMEATDGAKSIKVEYPMAPARRNWKTNLVGSLFTDSTKVEVEVTPGTGGEQGAEIGGQSYIIVKNADEFKSAFSNDKYDNIILGEDIVLSEPLTRAADPALTISKEKALTIDLNNFTLSATSNATGKNYQMFDVYGTLTVKNGNLEYVHNGDNMGWNNCTALFHVGGNGVLNIDGVVAKNLGGSDMAYVVDLTNATNIVVDVDNSTLESTYIPVRVFNNMKNGVNNVAIKNSTLKGKYCFWVQYWLADGRDEATLQQTLNLDIFNSQTGESNNNTFTYNNKYDAPVLYGFNEAVYFDQYGAKISLLTPVKGANDETLEGVGLDDEGNYVVTADAGIASIKTLIAADDNGFAGKTIILDADVDLANVKDMGESNAPIGATGERDDRGRLVCKPFKGTFDGNGKAIKNLYQSGWDMGYEWGQYGSIGLFSELEGATVKNVVIEGLNAQVEGGDVSFIAGSATGTCVFENITIENSSIGTFNNGIGAIIGWSGAGHYTFKNIKIGSDVVIGGLWGSFDQSCGGVVGQAEPGATYIFEDVEISCRLDVYNDCTASYDYYLYRMSGMIIGRCEKTTTIDGKNYPDLSKYNITCKNVTVNYGTWMNYHYCEPTPADMNGGRGMRVEPGYAYGGLPADHDHSQCVDNHYNCIPFDQLFGGAQINVRGIREYPGVTVNYPEAYTCPLCGKQHNVK